MGLEARKIFGYCLVFIGLFCLIFSLYSVFNVFTDAADPPGIFTLDRLIFSADSQEGKLPVKITVQLDPETRKIVNMFLYYLFMLFILTVGSRLSMLGAQFTKEAKGT